MAKKASLKSKSGEKMLFKYVPVYPQAPLDKNYHYYDGDVLKINNNLFTLIKSIDELKEYAKKCEGKIVGVDTETTGLTYFQDFIVGFSVCCEAGHAIYVPIRHQIRRTDKVKEVLKDEQGNPLLTKTGKVRTHTVNKYTDFEHPANLNPKEALDVLYEIMLKAKTNVMHNSEFDLTMIRAEGYDVMKCPTFDTTILTYLYDAENKGWNKLKEAAKIVLGRYPMKFFDALGGEENFRYVDLNVGYAYGAADALNVRDLYLTLRPKVAELLSKAPEVISMDGKPYNVLRRDNELIRAFTDYYNHVTLLVDRDTAKSYKDNIEEQLAKIEKNIYEFFNRGPFNLNSGSKEFKQAMADFNIDTGLKTETGAISYGKKGIEEMGRQLRALKDTLNNMGDIEYESSTGKLSKRNSLSGLKLSTAILRYGKKQFKIKETVNYLFLRTVEGLKMDLDMFFEELKLMYKNESKKLEILKCIQIRSSLMKALNSYITKLTETDHCIMRYKLQGTSSGRLSSGNGSKTDKSKNHYYIDLNAQNFTKPHSAMYNAYRSNGEGNILGWEFEPVTEEFVHENKDNPEYYFVEGSDPKNNIRACIKAPKGRIIASLDYSAQEYKMIAILSQDSVMLNNFKRGLDPHTSTAYAIWGEKNYDRQKRKKAKICNFLMNYSGGASTLSQSLDIPLEEAKEIIAGYEKGFWECTAWKRRSENTVIGKQHGVCYSIFGRPRQFITLLSTASKLQDPKEINKLPDDYNVDEVIKKGQAIEAGVKRRIVSHLIQSPCGDICRWDLIQLYRKYFKDRNPDIDFMTTVHDEINFSIVTDKVVDYVREIDDIMTVTQLSEELPITTSVDLGYRLGILYPFEWADEKRTILVPKRAS